jgi:phage terminase large subunit GpA-like protein
MGNGQMVATPTARGIFGQTIRRVATQYCVRDESVWRWAEKDVVLQPRSTSSPGRYDSSWIPYVRAWQDDFSNPHVRSITIVKGGQLGGTESLLNMLRYSIARDPGPTLWVMPSEGLARSFSETRLQPSLMDCKPILETIPEDPDKFKLLEMHLRDCTLTLVGSNSPASLASRPVRYLFGDELDKWAEASSKEAGALELARVRLTTYWNSKEVLTSTPTLIGGKIWQEYLLGSRHYWFVPCPHCSHMQQLVFSDKERGIKWPEECKTGDQWDYDAVSARAWYECESCHKPIQQDRKQAMVRAGEWRQTNLGCPVSRKSYHISALYSPFERHDWGKIAVMFLQAKKTVGGLQDFTNSILAEPWEQKIEAADFAAIAQRKASYNTGDPWPPEKRRFLSVDVQADILYWTCRAWGLGGISRLIDYGRVFGWGDLIQVQNRLGVKGCDVIVDSGFRTFEVKQCCARYGWKPFKGWDRIGFTKLLGGVTMPTMHKDTVLSFELRGSEYPCVRAYTTSDGITMPGIYGFNFNSDGYKDMLALFMSGEAPTWELPQNVSDEYLKQLAAEKRCLDEKTGKPIWKQISKDNHWGDCEIMNLIAAVIIGLVASGAEEKK